MKLGIIRLCAALALLCPAVSAQAVITCTVSSPGFITAYDPAAATQTIVQSYLTVTCQRNDNLNDPTTQSYSVEADTATTARLGANTVNYNLFRDSLCGSVWTTNNSRRLPVPAPGTMTLSGLVPTSVNISYWACLPAGQTGRPAGTYTDTTTMTLFSGTSNAVLATNTFPVSILMSATCGISTAPGAIVFNYVSFGPVANASTTFGATCTSTLPYTLALDATSGTMLGLNYSLALSAASGTGTGVQQTYTISGTMAAGQAGTCAVGTCSASQARTLTITY